jgi:hypothetical protein
MIRKNYVILTGGLGNQLFQINFAKFIQKRDGVPTLLMPCIGFPRRDSDGFPDSNLLAHELEVVERQSSMSNLLRGVSGLLLRFHLKEYSNPFFSGLLLILRLLASLIFSLYFRRLTGLSIPRNIGFENPKRTRFVDKVYIGYFQSYLYGQNLDFFRAIDKEINTEFSELFACMEKKSEAEKPVIVHVRLTDYREDNNFGTLSQDYYTKAIENVISQLETTSLWIFSDEPEECMKFIPARFQQNSQVMNFSQLSPLQNLLLMRLGKGYVIANSSYSWWACFSAVSMDIPVCAPDPWFAGMRTPNHLIPDGWNVVHR